MRNRGSEGNSSSENETSIEQKTQKHTPQNKTKQNKTKAAKEQRRDTAKHLQQASSWHNPPQKNKTTQHP
jgi:hypothetical protein